MTKQTRTNIRLKADIAIFLALGLNFFMGCILPYFWPTTTGYALLLAITAAQIVWVGLKFKKRK